MATKKTIFVAFAIEDERQRDFLKGQSLRECPAYTLLYQFSPKDTGQSKVK